MNKVLMIIILSLLIIGCKQEAKTGDDKMNIEGINFERLGHSSIKINSEKVIYIDPYKVKEDYHDADIILITHEHYDHCSIEDVEKVMKDDSVIVATSDCISKLNRFERNSMKIVQPGSKIDFSGIKVEAVPAYNTNKKFHPKENNWVGYIISVNNKRIYHAGDTDLISEMSSFKVDIAFLPVGGTYTMNAKEAAEAANRIKPKVVIPMHYGSIVGTEADAEKFKSLVNKGIEVKIL